MEDLTPPLLSATRELRWRIASGRSMKDAIRMYLEKSHSPFSRVFSEWWTLHMQGRPTPCGKFATSYQRAFIRLVERGCAGQPTLEHLSALEDELVKAAEAELDLHICTLPFKLLVPLLIFQFPAYLVLLLGPALRELMSQMGT